MGEDNVPSFEWDARKETENYRKHGVSFFLAQQAFLDASRVIARDVSHSRTESRYFCIGRAGGGILTVRFTYRNGRIRIIGAGYWRKGKQLYETQNHL